MSVSYKKLWKLLIDKDMKKKDLEKAAGISNYDAVVLMGLFTFLFLGAEYLYVDVLSRIVSEDKTVLAQNYALGVSAAGFLLYPLFNRFCKHRLTRAHREKQLKMSCQALHNAPPNRT